EVAYFSLTPAQLAQLKNQPGNRIHQLMLTLLNKPVRFIATLLISNSAVNIAIVLVSSYMMELVFNFEAYPLTGTIVNVVIITFVIVMFGDLIPKVYATKNNLKLAERIAIPLYITHKLFYPFSYLLASTTSFIEKRMKKISYQVTIDDLTHAIDIASNTNTPVEEKKILKGIVKFGNLDVTQIMKHRVDIEALDYNLPLSELLKLVVNYGYSRLPVYNTSLDNVSGVLHIKDLLPHLNKNDDFEWQQLIRKPFFVPESKMINDLLDEFQSKKMHLALVVDEFGGVVGLVTLEDVLEEIVGELNDEFDEDETFYTRIDDNNFVFEAKTLLNDVSRIMQIELTEFDGIAGETATLAGLVLELTGKIPLPGESVNFKNYKFTIESSDKRRIKRVKITRSVSPPYV
ncbi:MAG TPA: gliding motility-associated protein GldE, partial [Bacteroidia bacterium]|nr:gliding motility-associated protein GldE [Bacteroidia bacterium]